MLKISDYVAITAGFFGILLFYLIFSGIIVIDYGTDSSLPVIEWEKTEEKEQIEAAEYVVLYGTEEKSETTVQVMQMLDKLKKEYIAKSRIEDLDDEQQNAARVFIVTAGDPGQADEQQELLNLAGEEGKNIFYTILSGENADYEKQLGIFESREETEIDGMMIFEGLLVQGMVYYEELPMTVREITLDASCTKMIQERSKEEKKQNLLIPLLWKKQCGSGKIYAANGTLFSDEADIGLFTGVLADMEDVFLYPVVNSNAVLLDYFPDYEHADQQVIRELYSRDPVMYIRDVIWPAMDKISHSEQLILSGRSHMENKTDDYYDMQLQMQRSSGIILEKEEGNLLPVVCKGHIYSDDKRYRMESMASGEGLATNYLDIREIMGGREEAEFEWAAYSLELSKSMHDIYKNAQFLESVNWLEAEERFKRYEMIEPEFSVTDEGIQVSADGFADVWYCMIRTEKDPEDGQGYEAWQVGEDAYLLEIRQQEVMVPLN